MNSNLLISKVIILLLIIRVISRGKSGKSIIYFNVWKYRKFIAVQYVKKANLIFWKVIQIDSRVSGELSLTENIIEFTRVRI